MGIETPFYGGEIGNSKGEFPRVAWELKQVCAAHDGIAQVWIPARSMGIETPISWYFAEFY